MQCGVSPFLLSHFGSRALLLSATMDEETNELRNPFPSPPSHYTRYTNHNLKLLGLLKERAEDSEQPTNQHIALSDQKDVPDWDLTLLEKPRVDWILEEPNAYYDVYGDRWFVRLPSRATADP
jgi:mediator of RNA polymerase II transcription subunit 7